LQSQWLRRGRPLRYLKCGEEAGIFAGLVAHAERIHHLLCTSGSLASRSAGRPRGVGMPRPKKTQPPSASSVAMDTDDTAEASHAPPECPLDAAPEPEPEPDRDPESVDHPADFVTDRVPMIVQRHRRSMVAADTSTSKRSSVLGSARRIPTQTEVSTAAGSFPLL